MLVCLRYQNQELEGLGDKHGSETLKATRSTIRHPPTPTITHQPIAFQQNRVTEFLIKLLKLQLDRKISNQVTETPIELQNPQLDWKISIAFAYSLQSIDRRRIRSRASWGVKIETGEIENFLGQEIIMGFSQAFLDWEEATEAKGISIGEQRGISIGQQEQARSLVLRQLVRLLGILPTERRSQVEQLSVIQLDELGEALLDFEQLSDLTTWLDITR